MAITSLPLDVLRQILASATAPTLVRFSSTCRAADAAVIEELNFRYDSLLADYVHDRPAFRATLGTTYSIIAGSSAAAICGIPNVYVPGDLDIYCDEHAITTIRNLLVDKEHYEVVPIHDPRQYSPSSAALRAAEGLIPITDLDRTYETRLREEQLSNDNNSTAAAAFNNNEYTSGISDVIRLRRGNSYVDLIASSMPSSTFPIVNFWSTAPMCLLTEHAIHILYPRLHETSRALLNPFRLPPQEPPDPSPSLIDIIGNHKAHTRSLIAKYVDRGYDIQHTEHKWDSAVSTRPCAEKKAAACPLTVRSVNDSRGLHFSLRGNATTRLHSTPADAELGVMTSVWTRGGMPCGPFCSDRVTPVESTAYTISRNHIA